MRVAIVADSFWPTWNGVTNSVDYIAKELTALGHSCIIIAPGPGPRAGLHRGIPIHRTPSFSLPFYPEINCGVPLPNIYAKIAEFHPDIVHLASPLSLGAAALAVCRRLRIPAVAVYQIDVAGFLTYYNLTWAGRLIEQYQKIVHNLAELTLAPSPTACNALISRGVKRVSIWPRGVDIDRFHPKRRSASMRSQLLGHSAKFLIGYAGRVSREKQLDNLSCLVNLPETTVVVIGDGPLLQTLIRRYPSISFLGYKSGLELAQTVASLDVFIQFGMHETFCQAALEAMASGVPVVAPKHGALQDLIATNAGGATYDPDCPAQLRNLVLDLLLDPNKRLVMGLLGRQSAEGYSWKAACLELILHYKSLL